MTGEQTPVRVRDALPADAPLLVRFIRELADYERLADRCRPSEAALRAHLASDPPACAAAVAELGGEPVGFALWFHTYSTFATAVCMHLEDLYVVPEARGRGAGKALLQRVARAAAERGCARLDWNVLDWNRPAIEFYERLGARLLPDWRVCRVEGSAIEMLAGH
jgi:GNAT superfamily N-acetyltransferase